MPKADTWCLFALLVCCSCRVQFRSAAYMQADLVCFLSPQQRTSWPSSGEFAPSVLMIATLASCERCAYTLCTYVMCVCYGTTRACTSASQWLLEIFCAYAHQLKNTPKCDALSLLFCPQWSNNTCLQRFMMHGRRGLMIAMKCKMKLDPGQRSAHILSSWFPVLLLLVVCLWLICIFLHVTVSCPYYPSCSTIHGRVHFYQVKTCRFPNLK